MTLPSLTSLLEAFRVELLAQDTSVHTITAYLSDIRQFVTWYENTYGRMALDEVTPTDIRCYREALQEQTPPAMPATINRRLASLRRFFAWASERERTAVRQ